MYDPRSNIINLFSNNMVSASDGYTNHYVELYIRERNPDGDINYNSAGALIMDFPVSSSEEVSIGGHKHETEMIIPALLWIRKKKNMKNPDVFIKNVINTIQTTIRTNRLSLVTNGDVEPFFNINPRPSQSQDVYEYVINIKATKIE